MKAAMTPTTAEAVRILAIDPGNIESAYVAYNGGTIEAMGKVDNDTLCGVLKNGCNTWRTVIIEQIASMGMAVGEEVFETCVWTGRFMQCALDRGRSVRRIKRGEVKMHLCNNMRAKDPNIRQALIDRFGGASAIGKKKTPGPLYGVSGDIWAALAVAVTYTDKLNSTTPGAGVSGEAKA